MKRGPLITSPFLSDAAGLAEVSVPTAVLTTLNQDDIVHWYAESGANTQITTSGGSSDLATGQLSLRSVLASGGDLAIGASQGFLDTTTGDLARASFVSHFSNARMTLLESGLGITEPIRPTSFTTSSADFLELVRGGEEVLTRELSDAGSPTTSKFLLVAAATKAILEKGVSQLVAGGSSARTDAGKALLQLASGTTALSAEFQAEIDNVITLVRQDLSQTDFQASLPAGQSSVLQNVSSNEVKNSALVTLPPIRMVSVADLNATTPFVIMRDEAVLSDQLFSGSNLHLAPTVLPPGGDFPYSQ